MKILFKYPTRSRPEIFKKTLEKYINLLSGQYEYSFIISCDIDDKSMHNNMIYNFLKSKNTKKVQIKTYFNELPQTKITACNANLEGEIFDILVLCSDDMIPVVQSYDNIIVENMKKHFPNMDGCLHFNDGRTKDILATLTIMGYNLYKEFGYIYHPSYVTEWCDNEFTQVCKQKNKYAYIDEVIIKHEWCRFGVDQLYQRNSIDRKNDEKMYGKRLSLGFPKEVV
jgi:hypothetical protein